MTVNQIAQDRQTAVGGRSVHVVSVMLPIWGQTFSSGVFYYFLSKALFFGKFSFVFSESEHTQGRIPFAELHGISRLTP